MINVDREKMIRWIKTSVVLLAMTNSGINVGIFSPALPDIAYITSSSTAAMSTTLIWTGIFSMAGAILFGPLFDKYDGMGVLTVAVTLQGVFLAFTPWCPHLIGFQIFAALTCLFNFGIMAGTVSVNCVIWQKHPEMIAPIVQITDLMHAVGAAIAPQIIEPFVGKHKKDNSSSIMPYDNDTFPPNTTFQPFTTAPAKHYTVQPVQIAFVIVAIFDLVCGAVCLACYLAGRDRDDSKLKSYEYEKHRMVRRRSYSLNEDGRRLFGEEEPVSPVSRERSDTGNLSKMIMKKNFENRIENENGGSDLRRLLQERRQQRAEEQQRLEAIAAAAHGHGGDNATPDFSPNAKMIYLAFIVFMFFTLNGGRDALLTGLLFTYLDSLGWSAQFGTLLVTLYHVTRVVVHIAVVFLAKCVSPLKITIANQLILVASSGFMLATVHDARFFLAIGIVLTGFATSSLHPTAITLAQQSFKVSAKMMGLFFAGIGSGSIVFAPIAGILLQVTGPASFPALMLAISVAASVLLLVWVIMARIVKAMFQREDELDDMSTAPSDEHSERSQLLS